jgi:hypothetical protein
MIRLGNPNKVISFAPALEATFFINQYLNPTNFIFDKRIKKIWYLVNKDVIFAPRRRKVHLQFSYNKRLIRFSQKKAY